MATPFVRGMTFTSRVATADINSLTFQRRAEIPKSVMAKLFVRGYGPTGEGEKDPIRIDFQSPLIPLFGLYPSSSTFPKRERKRKVYLLGRRANHHQTANHSLRCNHLSSPGVYPARREGSCGGRLIIRFLTAKSYTSFRISCSE